MRPQNKFLAFWFDAFCLSGWMLGAIRQTLRGRHVKHLEAENARLQRENRALWQSIWANQGRGIPDIPREPQTEGASWAVEAVRPIEAQPQRQAPQIKRRMSPQQYLAKLERDARERHRREAAEEVEKHAQRLKNQPIVAAPGAGQMSAPEPEIDEEPNAA